MPPLRSFPSILALFVAVACTPDIAQDPPPPEAIVARFDPSAVPPVVPTPNDLAKDPKTGRLVVSSTDATPAAQREFNDDYLTGLDGFPFESTAEVLLTGRLDPSTVNPNTVLVLDVTGNPVPVTTVNPRYDDAKPAIVVPPPPGGWLRAHRYAVALIGGGTDRGLRGARGEDVIGTPAWVLVSGSFPLVECEIADASVCRPTVDIIPSDKFDPHEKFADQTEKAKRLEALRKGFAPLLDGIASARGVKKGDIPVLWTFSILDGVEVTFDPANRIIPFPNDAVRTGPEGKVSLPNPQTGAPLSVEECAAALSSPLADRQLQLTCGLNTLDGFSTQVSPVSENSHDLGAVQQGLLDARTIDPRSAGLIAIVPGVPAGARTTPRVSPCLNCLSSTTATGQPQTSPQQIQWRLEAPLDEKTTYLAYLTTEARDDQGKPIVAPPAFAFLRSKASLLEDGKSAVSTLTTEQARQLEPLRARMEPALDALSASGVPRSRLALAFAFTTQSEASVLDQLAAVPSKAPGLPEGPIFVRDATTELKAAAAALQIPTDAVAQFFVGAFLTPYLLTGPGGTLNPAAPQVHRVDFVMSVPASPAPAGGYPTTIFGHGFTRSRNDLLPVANALAAAGQVAISSDAVRHGERTSCTGSAAATKQPTDDAACANPQQQRCNGDPVLGLCISNNDGIRNACAPGPAGDAFCTLNGQGRCAPDLKCQAADLARDTSGRPAISGWNILSLTNFFGTRDNFRQQVIDLSQLARVVKSAGPAGLSGQTAVAVNGGRINYLGQSLGGILGTLFNAVSPDTTHVVLNVPGGALPQIILNAPSFSEQKATLLATLAAGGIQPGTPQFDQFIGIVQWILDPADPANMAYRLTHGVDVAGTMTPNGNRKAFIQFVEGDQTVPNIANLALVRAAAGPTFATSPPSFGCAAPLFCYMFTEIGDGFDANSLPPETRHGFLLRNTVITVKGQTQVATFLASGALP